MGTTVTPNTIRLISVPKVVPIKSGGPLSWSGVLKMEKNVDAWVAAGSLGRYEVARSAVPPKTLKPGFETAKALKIPMRDISGDPKAKGFVYGVHQTDQTHDYLALYSDKSKLLAVRQKSGDYAPGFFWSNYQTRTVG